MIKLYVFLCYLYAHIPTQPIITLEQHPALVLAPSCIPEKVGVNKRDGNQK